ncbi:unnamed protein product [Oikopleura dioica]|uniref:Uncharacterized protein n=1 Tax=Oikopleura dioica TaxID=34765 RepID=E4Y2Q2_OIKDI|nr:unnamed protein product [Oikopleura dioica]CBY35361.1 unnamed protein product [Oikopleura dioica]
MLRLSRRLSLSARFAGVSTDTDGDLDELNSQYKKFTEKKSFASKISPSKLKNTENKRRISKSSISKRHPKIF